MDIPASENPFKANVKTDEKPKKLATPASWAKGQSGNPAGRPATGFQGFKDRLAWWMESKTIGEIKKLVSNPKKWDKLVSADAMVARRIYEACGPDGTGDFIAILDRLLGKPTQTTELNVTHGLADRLDKAEAIMLESKPVDAEYAVIPSVPVVADLEEE